MNRITFVGDDNYAKMFNGFCEKGRMSMIILYANKQFAKSGMKSAIDNEQIEVINFLLTNYGDIFDLKKMMTYAIDGDHANVVRYLIENYTIFNLKRNLKYAINKRSAQVVSYLLENHKDEFNMEKILKYAKGNMRSLVIHYS